MPTLVLIAGGADDDPIPRILDRAGFAVRTAATPAQALTVLRRQTVDLVLLDLDLPATDPWALVAALRQLAPTVSLLVLSATQRRSADIVAALEHGADAYLVRPVPPPTLLAHVTALLRRPHAAARPDEPASAEVVQLGALTIDPARHAVWVGPASTAPAIALNRSEFAVLLALARRAGQVLSPAALLDQIWGPAYAGDDRAVYVRVYQIRKKLAAFPNAPQIETIPRCGYRLTVAPVPAARGSADIAS